jgi:hypothetical protein
MRINRTVWTYSRRRKTEKNEEEGEEKENKKTLFLCRFETFMVTICNEYSAVSVSSWSPTVQRVSTWSRADLEVSFVKYVPY